MLKKSNIFPLLLIFCIAFSLRIFRLNTNFNFTGEFGLNLLDIKNAIDANRLPLVGPATSHPWLFFGPIYYWLGIIVMSLFGTNPLVFAFIGVIVGCLIVIANFFVVKRIFDKRIAYISSFLLSISPLFILFSREARFFYIIVLLFYPLIWSLYKIWKKNPKYFFWAGLTYGSMFSFHYSPILLAPFIILIFWSRRVTFRFRNFAGFFVAFLIPNLTLIIFDSKQNFQMLTKLFLWVPYRALGFLGLYPKNNVNSDIVIENMNIINQFFGESLTSEKRIWPIISSVLIGYLIYKGYKFIKSKKISFGWILIFSLGLSGIVGIFVHGGAPIHYFLPIFPIPILIASLLIANVWEYRKGKIIILSSLAILVFLNLENQFRENKFYSQPKMTVSPHFVPYNLLLRSTLRISESADGRTFGIKRVGPYDYFDENYSHNYKFLLWRLGNEPVASSDLIYTIVEQEGEIEIIKEEVK